MSRLSSVKDFKFDPSPSGMSNQGELVKDSEGAVRLMVLTNREVMVRKIKKAVPSVRSLEQLMVDDKEYMDNWRQDLVVLPVGVLEELLTGNCTCMNQSPKHSDILNNAIEQAKKRT